MDLVEPDDVRGHFSRVVEEMKTRSNAREASFLDIIQSLENENTRLEDDVDALEKHLMERDASVEGLMNERQQLEERVAALQLENERLRHASTAKYASRDADDAMGDLEVRCSQQRSNVVALEASARSNVLSTIRETMLHQQTSAMFLGQQIAALMERRQALMDAEAWHRTCTIQSEADAMESLTQQRGWWLARADAVEVERRRLRDSTKFAVQLAISVCASKCIGAKGNMVEDEHRAWAELLAQEESLRAGDTITLDAPTDDDHVFWQCCLEEAQAAIQSLPVASEDEGVMRDVCLRFDIPMVMSALRQQRPQSAFEEWMDRVVKPLQVAIAGRMTLYEFSAVVDGLLKASTQS